MTKVVFISKFDYVCDICKKQHPAGTRTIYTDSKQLAAADCKWPDKKGSANPIPAGASGRTGAGKPSGVVLTSPEADVSGRLALAVGILCKEFGLEPSQVNPDSVVLAEIMRQLYGSLWLNKEMR